MFKSISGSFLLLLVSTTVQAQLKPLQFTEYTLENGLHVILHRDATAPVVAVVLHYRVGSFDEDPRRTGFAHFFEHLMFEGTEKIPRGKLTEIIQSRGGSLNAYTRQDETVYHMVVPSHEVRLPLWLEAQRMRGLVVDSIGLETQRGVVKEERKVRYDNRAYGGSLEKIVAHLMKGTQYEWTPIGASQHIDSAGLDEFKAFYDKYYQPSNAILAVSGDFDEGLVRETIEAYYGGIPTAPRPMRPERGTPTLTKSITLDIEDNKARTPAVFMGLRGPAITSDDQPAMDIIIQVLSGGESSRLFRTLVDSLQLCSYAGGLAIPMEFDGLLYFYTGLAPGANPEVIQKALEGVLTNIADKGITSEEFEKARNVIETNLAGSRLGSYNKGLALTSAHRYEGSTAAVNTGVTRYESITLDEIKVVASRYLSSPVRVTLRYHPPKQ